jgi:sulfatase modifying factor 1
MRQVSLFTTFVWCFAACSVDDGNLLARPCPSCLPDAAGPAGGDPEPSPPDAAVAPEPEPAVPDAAVAEPGPADAPAPLPPDAAVVVAPVPLDAAPLPPDAPPNPCPPSTGGPELVPAAGFCIDATEVSNEQYAVFLGAHGAGTSGQPAACEWNRDFTPDSAGGSLWPAPAARARRPVVNIDWCDAYAFCRWAGKRLCGRMGSGSLARWEDSQNPAVSQWSAACTAGGVNRFPYGNSFKTEACNDGQLNESAAILVDVGSRAACRTASGAFDLSGNVEEWVDACSGEGGRFDQCAVVGASAFTRIADDLSCQGSPYPDRRSSTYELRGFRCCAP